jgi:hypothetical protein
MVRVRSTVIAAILLLAGVTRAQVAPPTSKSESTDSDAPVDPVEAASAPARTEPPSQEPRPPPRVTPASPSEAGWTHRFYGFVEFDAMRDTTQSYGAASNNALIARPGSYAGAHARTQLTVNNSQLGAQFTAPEFQGMKAMAQAELDFFGALPTDATEQTTFTSPSPRMRLFYARINSRIIDVIAGQYHDLFGWGGAGFYQNSLAFLGVGGELYHRSPQLRLSKTIEGRVASLTIAAAAVRPVQRDAGTPEIEAGLKFTVNLWQGFTAQGFGQPALSPLAIGVSGVSRHFAVAEFVTVPGDAKTANGWGLAANAFLPIIPAASATDRRNALAITGEFSTGTGISDLYTGLTGGALFPLLPDPTGNITPPPIYRPNIDSGIVTYDANGNLKTIDWRAFVVGLQYYLPIDLGRIWISATFSRLRSANILALTPEAARGGVFFQQDYLDGNLFTSLTPAAQLGLSYQFAQQTFGDLPLGGPHPVAKNQRGELGFRLFF